jgi:flagellar protein FlbD
MIKVTLINDTAIALNSDLIEVIEATPDTIISLTTGKKMIVRESVDDVIDRIIGFRRRIGITVREIPSVDESGSDDSGCKVE